MILTLNTIIDAEASRRFDDVVVPRLRHDADRDFEIRHLRDPAALPTDFAGYTHLLVSGSELSAARSNPRDAELASLIRGFVATGKPVLGICYGFQMLARALTGRPVCRRTATPEFGWKAVRVHRRNPIFAGLDRIVTMHSHYDEVFDLGPSFTILASTDDCQVQAAQYGTLPVWGVQFHPELGYDEGERMLASNLETEPLAPALASYELSSPADADANLIILRNFLRATPAEAAA